jgi:uncharacterized protein YdaU (DUF1376 family)
VKAKTNPKLVVKKPKALALPMLPWWPADYFSSTRAFTLAERGAYTDLLFYAWINGPLPRQPHRLARLIGVNQKEFDRVWPTLKSKFKATPKGLTNNRLERERRDVLARKTKASKKARDAAKGRWGAASGDASSNASSMGNSADASSNASSNATSIAQAMLGPCPPSSSSSSEIKNKKRERERGTPLPGDWKPSPETEAKARQQRPDLDQALTLRKFRNHHLASGKEFVDWDSAYLVWVDNEKQRPGIGNQEIEADEESHLTEEERIAALQPIWERAKKIGFRQPQKQESPRQYGLVVSNAELDRSSNGAH